VQKWGTVPTFTHPATLSPGLSGNSTRQAAASISLSLHKGEGSRRLDEDGVQGKAPAFLPHLRTPFAKSKYTPKGFLRYNESMSEEPISIPETIDLAAFISREAHDLKSPFNRILGFTKMVLKGMDGPLTDLQREDLTTVYENSRQAMSFVSNLIDMARLQRDEKTPQAQPCDLKDVLQRAADAWRALVPEEAAPLEMSLPQADCPAQADAALLQQAFRSLLHYAAAWTRSGAPIQVRVTPEAGRYTVHIHSRGEHDPAAAEMELTMWSFIAARILRLHGGTIRQARQGEASVSFEVHLPA